jgi:methylenetetrahydrofolate dehydrogenase (NADP+)/methenyltetrahydrofolate cyclohydrolase
MTARILDGKEIGRSIRSQIRREIKDLVGRKLGRPKLAVILVGEDAGSQIYVRNKERACAEVGIETLNHHLPPETSQEALLGLVARMNEDPSVNGVLVQLPLPKDIDDRLILQSIDPEKDVDGFHPLSYGKLVLGVETLSPATPAGVIAILEHACLTIEGQHVVIVGASQIVGKPLSALFVNRLATVTVCHLKTRDLKTHTLRADILVSATGVGGIITADMVREGAVVIDVGISRVGQKLVGDVDFEKVKEKASAITPVPGGVGPMTVTMLLVHTLRAYQTQALARGLAGRIRVP